MMSRMECDVVRDLLPLYVDGGASAESRALVEAHLALCPDCRAECEALKETLVLPKEDSAQPLEDLKRSLRRKRRRTAALCIVLPLVLLLGWWLGGRAAQQPPRINFGDALYVREACLIKDPTAGTVTALPAGCVELGGLHMAGQTDIPPSWDTAGINIHERYDGNTLWLDQAANALYLEDPAGFYVRFVWERPYPSERFQIQHGGKIYVNLDWSSGNTPPPAGSKRLGAVRHDDSYTTGDPAGELCATNLLDRGQAQGTVWLDPSGDRLYLQYTLGGAGDSSYKIFVLDPSVPAP